MASTGVSRIEGIDPFVAEKAPCKVATTANITLSGAQTVNGVAVAETTPKTRVLVRVQTDATENGIYDVMDTAWVRSDDFDGTRDVVDGTTVFVNDGTTLANSLWRVDVTNPVTFGTTSIAFSQLNAISTTSPANFATLALLKAATDTSAGNLYSTTEHTATYGYEGSNTYLARAVTGGTDDNGSLIKSTGNTAIEFVGLFPNGRNTKQFGAAGDNSANDTTALTNWLAALGSGNYEATITGPRVGYLPPGKYKYTTNLTVAAHTKVFGVPGNSVLVPGAAVTKALIQGSASTVGGIVLNGAATTGAIGLAVGTEGALVDNGVTRQVRAVNFTGTGARGIKVAEAVAWTFYDPFTSGNEYGLEISKDTSLPTTITFYNFKAKQNVNKGIYGISGREITFSGGICELNGEEGVFLGGSAGLSGYHFIDGFWLEGNQQNTAAGAARNATYEMVVDGSSAEAKVELRGVKHSWDLNGAKFLRFIDVDDYLIDGVQGRPADGWIGSIEGTSQGNIANWDQSLGSQALRITATGQTAFTPVLTCATPGDLSVAYAVQKGYFTRLGNQVHLRIFIVTSTFTHTTASGEMRITGLPLTSVNQSDGLFVGPCIWQGITKASYTDVNARLLAGSATITLRASGSGQNEASVDAADAPTGGTVRLSISMTYEV